MKVISITSLIEENNGIKGIYRIDLHDLHTPRTGARRDRTAFCRSLRRRNAVLMRSGGCFYVGRARHERSAHKTAAWEEPAACFGACFDAGSRSWCLGRRGRFCFGRSLRRTKQNLPTGRKKGSCDCSPWRRRSARTVTEAGKRLGTL